MAAVPVRSISTDGTAVLEDGRQMQLVVDSRTGALGVRRLEPSDQVAGLDQVGQIPDRSYFDTSGLDQT